MNTVKKGDWVRRRDEHGEAVGPILVVMAFVGWIHTEGITKYVEIGEEWISTVKIPIEPSRTIMGADYLVVDGDTVVATLGHIRLSDGSIMFPQDFRR